MIEITKVIEWDMGHRVPNHKNKCKSPHGHRYRLELTIRGTLVEDQGSSSEGMVFDFADVKAFMMQKIHDPLDHGFMMYEKDPLYSLGFEQISRDTGINIVMVPFIPTAENIAVWCYEQLLSVFPEKIKIVRCRVFETPNSWADFLP